METCNFFVNQHGRLRSGWRLGIFVVAFAVVAKLFEAILLAALALAFKSQMTNDKSPMTNGC